MRKTIQSEVQQVTCDRCGKDITAEVYISFSSYCKDSLEEEKHFCSARHLLEWLESLDVSSPTAFLREVDSSYDYYIRLNGEDLEALVRLLQLKLKLKEIK